MGSIDFSDLEPTSPPPPGFKPQLVDAMRRADEILANSGAVGERTAYSRRHLARWRAQRTINLLVQMGLRRPAELSERVWSDGQDWFWSVTLRREETQ